MTDRRLDEARIETRQAKSEREAIFERAIAWRERKRDRRTIDIVVSPSRTIVDIADIVVVVDVVDIIDIVVVADIRSPISVRRHHAPTLEAS